MYFIYNHTIIRNLFSVTQLYRIITACYSYQLLLTFTPFECHSFPFTSEYNFIPFQI